MKIFLFYILMLLIAARVPAQENNYAYAIAGEQDTMKIMAEIKRASILQPSDIDSSASILKEALSQSRKINFANGTGSALVYLGMGYTATGNQSASLEAYLEALPYAQKCSGFNPELLATLYTGIGTPYLKKRQYNEAGYYYYKALQEVMNTRLQYTPVASHLYINLSNFWKIMNRYDYGILYLNQARKAAEQNKDTVSLIAVYASLGGSYYHNDDMKNAYAYTFLAYELAAKKHIVSRQQITLNNIGIYLRDENKPLEAIPYYKKAISLADDEHSYLHNLNSYYNLGFAYYETGHYEDARKLILTTLHKAEKLDMDKEDLGSAMQVLSLIYQKEKKYDTANHWLNKYVAFTDSITHVQTDSSINRLEENYRLSEKDRVIAQKQLQLSKSDVELKNKNIWIVGVSGSVLVLTALLLGFYMAGKHKQRTQAEKIRNLEQGKELSELKAMLEGEEKERTRLARELHDGIGGMLAAAKLNLGSVRAEHKELTGIRGLDDLMELLDDTAKEIRQTAHNLMPDVLIKNNLRDALLLYCSSINTGDKLEIDLQFHGEMELINKPTELILYRITQELIQNIIKHAKATEAIIQIVQDNGRLNLIVEDNGEGFETGSNVKGFGMQNLEYRVQALQGYVSVTSAAGKGTSVYIEFDLDKLR